jgi:KaiC/GvpD/RAD55 family RecA-like ATPase
MEKNNNGPVRVLNATGDETPVKKIKELGAPVEVSPFQEDAENYFDYDEQATLLGLMLKDDHFCGRATAELSKDPELRIIRFWKTSQLQLIYKLCLESYDRDGVRPSVTQVRAKIAELAEDERESYLVALEYCLSMDVIDRPHHIRKLQGFIQMVHLQKGLKRVKEQQKIGVFSNNADILNEALTRVNRVNLNKIDEVRLSDVHTLTKALNSNMAKIPTGHKELDALLKGGLPRETLTTVLGGSNAGKSLFCTSLGANAIREGYKVLHINLEGTRDEATFRYNANLADIDFSSIEEGKLGTAESKRLQDVIEKYEGQLLVRNMLDWGTTVEEVQAYVKEAYKQFPFDVLIVDYGQILKTKVNGEKFDRQTDVYRALDALSKEFRCVVISPVQASRDAMKNQRAKQKSGEGLWVIHGEDIADCIEIFRISAQMITLTRTETEEERGWVRICLDKQRRGKKGVVWGEKADYAKSKLITNDPYKESEVTHVVSSGSDEEGEPFVEAPAMNGDKYTDVANEAEARYQKKLLQSDVKRMNASKVGGEYIGDHKVRVIRHNERIDYLNRTFGMSDKVKADKEEAIPRTR